MMFSSEKGANACGIFRWNWGHKSTLNTGLLHDASVEIELSDYQRVPSPASESPSGLLNGEGLKLDSIADLDIFFERVYSYYCDKGLWCIIAKWIVELLSLAFAISFSGFFLLFVDWRGLRNAKCGIDAVESGTGPCDLIKEALQSHPFIPFTFSKGIIVGYLAIFTIYWLLCFLRFFAQLKYTLEIRNFYQNCLNITDREVQTSSWTDILEKVVHVQHSHQLCVVKDLSCHEIIMRIMRKENYLIGMLNKGILAFPVSDWIPGAGPAVISRENGKKNHLILTKTLEWIINWCVLQSMFDRNYCVRRDFISNPSSLRKRLMMVGIGMFLLSPFLIIFLLVYFFLRHAEQFYHQPSTALSRRWSNLSRWIFREFNEVDHLFNQRMNNSLEPAILYLKQFPSPIISLVGKFISFVFGGFAATIIIIALLEESLLEGHIFGRNLVWYGAIFTTITALSRAAVGNDVQVFDPKGAMALVVHHTHHMPKRWRGKENTDSVRIEFESLFQYTGMILLEEMASIFLTPYLLIFVVPERVNDILQFISDFTAEVEGVGHVCSFSAFDFESHGNSKYGSPFNALHNRRSSQGKMEKSFLSFKEVYPSWEPNSQGQQFLSGLHNFGEQTQEAAREAYAPTEPWEPITRPGNRAEPVHWFTSRDDLYNAWGVQRPAFTLDNTWMINPEQRAHPYFLDWYYVSQPRNGATNYKDRLILPSETHCEASKEPCQTHDFQHTERSEENWDFPLAGRSQSHFHASTSGIIFHESVFQNTDPSHPEAPTQSHWWSRRSPCLTGPETSFLEPPSFSNQNFGHHDGDTSDRCPEYQEEDAEMKLHRLSRTTYLSDCDNDEAFSLPFNDIYTGPVKSLPFESAQREGSLQ